MPSRDTDVGEHLLCESRKTISYCTIVIHVWYSESYLPRSDMDMRVEVDIGEKYLQVVDWPQERHRFCPIVSDV